ncbi:odorant receptor 83a-like isoform X2 [Microplitis mediator]|uniref:odorant receptor 83a-like isoform X2 n=1 Tax=Microplitis mediator TaxID=375433 RepID=UPI0025567065|nr:odorant receptor 83a-like isoform X2 [Microplitis mediator]
MDKIFSDDTHYRFLKINITMLRYSGIWSFLPTEKIGWKIFNFIYRIFNLVVFIFYLITVGADAVDNITDLAIVGYDGCFFFGPCAFIYKSYKYSVSQDKILKLADEIYKPIDELLQSSVFLIPRETGVLPIRAIYPFDTTSSPNYELAILFQFYCVCYCMMMMLVFDSSAIGLMRWLTIQVMILTTNYKSCNNELIKRAKMVSPSESIKTYKNIIASKVTDEELEISNFIPFRVTESQEINDDFNWRFITCIKNHQRISKVVNNFNSTYSSIFLAQFAVSATIICLNGFVLILNTSNAANLVRFGIYFSLCFGQLFVWCWYGNQLTSTAETMTYNQWMSGWECAYGKLKSNELRNLVTIAMMPAMKPFAFNAVGLFALSMPTLLAVVKSSYSMLILLTTVTED